jgi:hypothetical protein
MAAAESAMKAKRAWVQLSEERCMRGMVSSIVRLFGSFHYCVSSMSAAIDKEEFGELVGALPFLPAVKGFAFSM